MRDHYRRDADRSVRSCDKPIAGHSRLDWCFPIAAVHSFLRCGRFWGVRLDVRPARSGLNGPAAFRPKVWKAIAKLDVRLASDDGAAARRTVRRLIEKIVVQLGSARGGKRRPIQRHGDLYRMLEFASAACDPNAQKPRSVRTGALSMSLVAGAATAWSMIDGRRLTRQASSLRRQQAGRCGDQGRSRGKR